MKRKIKKKKETIAKDENKIAYDFSIKVYKQFKEVIKTIVLFGSVAKNEAGKKSDIDLIIIVDDCTIDWDQELIAWYREELAKIISKEKYKDKLHVSTVTLSTFWDEVREGDPTIINIIRYGETILDYGGFFEPLKILLAKGKLHATPEAIYNTLKRSPDHIARAKYNLLSGVEALYWSMVDAAHAALMAEKEIPPSPEHIPDMLTAVFVKSKKIDKKYVDWYQELYDMAREVMHGTKTKVSPKEYEDQEKRAEEFLKKMFKITDEILKNEKIIKIKNKK